MHPSSRLGRRIAALVTANLLGLLGLPGPSAFAQEPVITEQGSTVTATLDLAVPAEAVRALLADPVASARLIPDLISTEVLTQGRCQDLGLTTRGLTRPLQVRVRRCPTADGWRQDLLQSDDFTTYEVVWQIQPLESGTRVIYRIAMNVNLPVPAYLIHKGMVVNATGTLKSLKSKLGK